MWNFNSKAITEGPIRSMITVLWCPVSRSNCLHLVEVSQVSGDIPTLEQLYHPLPIGKVLQIVLPICKFDSWPQNLNFYRSILIEATI